MFPRGKVSYLKLLLTVKMIKYYIMAAAMLPIFGFAQTGPGGVGNSSGNVFWIKAGNGVSPATDGASVSAWNDVSGNANHLSQSVAVQQPVYRTNVLNGYPALQFDNNSAAGQNDYMIASDSPVLDNTNGLTIFSVTRPLTLGGDGRAIVSKRTNVGVNHSYMFFYYTSDYLFADISGLDNRFSSSPTAFSANTSYITGLHYDGTLPTAQRSKIFSGNTLLVTSAETDASIPDYASPLLVGTTHVGDPRPFGGYIAEVIIFREALNETRRTIINNYLSAKYNIPLATADLYTMDNPGNGNFDHEMAGIGRISATDLHADAKGSSIIRILNPNGLDNGEFMLWGHNNGTLQASNLTDIPSGTQARLDRVWRVSEVNTLGAATDVGAVDIRIDLTGLGPVNPAHLRLLVDTNNDGLFSNEVGISGATDLGSNVFQFTGVTALTNQSRFTVGTTNKLQTPLPITMVSFDATLQKRSVSLDWQTASELNNDYFTAEHSQDGNTWEPVGTLKGAGNSTSLNNYTLQHNLSEAGVHYYRIKQTDFDGKFSYSDVRSVMLEQAPEIMLFPNPAKETVLVNRGTNAAIEIRNTLGQIVQAEQTVSENTTQLDVSALPRGSYLVTIREESEVMSKRLIVE